MRKQEKDQLIESLKEQLLNNNYFYLTDTSELNSEKTAKLRRMCFKRDIKLVVVKNTLLKKAMDRTEKDFSELYPILHGSTSIMFAQTGNLPAKLIKDFRKAENVAKPILKGAYVAESCYIGENQLEALINLKSKNELIADVVALLQSPMRNVLSQLQSGNRILTGVLKTLSEKTQ